MEVEGAEPGRAMTPEEVLDELRDEVRESETTYETHEPHEHTPCATEDGKKKKKKKILSWTRTRSSPARLSSRPG